MRKKHNEWDWRASLLIVALWVTSAGLVAASAWWALGQIARVVLV